MAMFLTMDSTMKILLFAILFLAGCTLPQVIYIDRNNDAAFWQMHQNSVRASEMWNAPVSQPGLVNPLRQRGSSMGFMCRDAINRGDSSAAMTFC